MRSVLLTIFLASVLSLISHSMLAQTPQIIYVNIAATGSANGTSWANAYPELRTALTAAASISGQKEIWVAQGEYKPTSDLNRLVSFEVSTNTFLYGGFVGNETSKNDRNWKKNRTVLSGDLGRMFDKSDNTRHVVRFTDVEQAGIDGFIITEGNSPTTGGGVYIFGSTATTKPIVSNCEIINNSAAYGGGLASIADGSTLVAPTVVNCYFNGNHATYGGGGARVDAQTNQNDHPAFVNCTFSSNTSDATGGAVLAIGTTSVINCTVTGNSAPNLGSAFSTEISGIILRNSIVWKNFRGTLQNPDYSNQIFNNDNAGVTIENNIIQGGYGTGADNNIDSDPKFEIEPSLVGKYPRTSIIPVSSTNRKYENQLEFSGPYMGGPWPYHAFKDHAYNKIYMPGLNLQVLDFSNLVNNKPTSTVYTSHYYPRTQLLAKSIHSAGNSIYFASFFSGMFSVHRQTGALTAINVFAGEPVTPQAGQRQGPKDLVIDDVNNLLYCPVFYDPGSIFYGLLELNLTTQTKRWITTTSTPVSISPVLNVTSDAFWGIHRLMLDEPGNTLYVSTGNGVWWWNRSTNATGTISSAGGITLAPGSPSLPSNLTTGMFMDHDENKLYIGTHAGLFVWNRNNNTTRVYNTSNSKLRHNLINTITKNEEFHLIYVACEEGGLFVINTQTGEETVIRKDEGSNVHPQFMDDASGSAYYDAIDKKLYATADHWTGGVWVQDYNNLIPDYGDLRLKEGSPAIDRGNPSYLPSSFTVDIDGLARFTDYSTLSGTNSLDLGAHEKVFSEEEQPAPAVLDDLELNYVLSFNIVKEGITDEETLDNYPVRDVNKSIQYVDGLGRPVQSIQIQGSPTRHDIVQPIVYDEFGREKRRYLPFVSGNNGDFRPTSEIINEQGDYVGVAQVFYDGGANSTIAEDDRPYSETVFEPSPLNRPLSNYGPGGAWAPVEAGGADKPISYGYFSNVHALTGTSTAEAIYAFKVNAIGGLELEDPASGYVEEGGYFSSNQLSIKSTKDENGNAVREYTNKQGQVILKKVQALAASTDLNNLDAWACTYYIYDDIGNLRIVLQPEGFKALQPLLNQN